MHFQGLSTKEAYGKGDKFKSACIRLRSDLLYWRKVYGHYKEFIPKDIPQPFGKRVLSTHWVDANLTHFLFTGRYLIGILHMLNQTPADLLLKNQNTIDGSEFIADFIAVDQIVDIRNTLRYLGGRVLLYHIPSSI